MTDILVDSVTKTFGETRVIGPTSLSVAEGEFVSLLGPSGSGKSTILNMIAGLAEPSSGTVSALGSPVTGPGPERGMVFQRHALLPWMTARGNIEFGLRHPEVKDQLKPYLMELAKRLELEKKQEKNK